MESCLPLPPQLTRAVGLHHWQNGLSQFDGKTPVRVFIKKEDSKNVWISSIEKLGTKVMCITRYNGKIREMFESSTLVC
jgi:hypothetical protein